jgi:hypothetical protein
LKVTYNFSSRSSLRLIGQYYDATFDPSLYHQPVGERDRGFTSSALFAYKLNWQTVLFLGYGDSRALDEHNALSLAGRELFLKVSYAFQE